MNEKISYIKLPNITTSELQDVVDFLNDNEIEYVEYYLEDLQNRIDRTYKYVSQLSSKGRDCEIYYNIKKEILNILKESGE